MSTSDKQTILVVDDDILTGTLVTGALQGHFDVTVETSGARAVAVASRVKPTLMLQDLNMPNVDGFEVLRQLKENPLTSTIPVICISSDSDEMSRNRARSLGASGYLKKPLEMKALSKDILSLLESLTIVMESASKNRKFVIAFNHGEKNRLIRDDLSQSISQGRKTLLLSLQEGGEFCDDSLIDFIKQKQLLYLQVQPSLITKFPYLQDLSPVVADLRSFVNEDTSDYILYIDEPLRIMNIHESKNACARIHTLKEAFLSVTKQIKCFGIKDNTEAGTMVLNEMATIFCR